MATIQSPTGTRAPGATASSTSQRRSAESLCEKCGKAPYWTHDVTGRQVCRDANCGHSRPSRAAKPSDIATPVLPVRLPAGERSAYVQDGRAAGTSASAVLRDDARAGRALRAQGLTAAEAVELAQLRAEDRRRKIHGLANMLGVSVERSGRVSPINLRSRVSAALKNWRTSGDHKRAKLREMLGLAANATSDETNAAAKVLIDAYQAQLLGKCPQT
jgi:hypothetical protein